MKILNYQGTEHLIDKIYDLINSGGSADYIVEEGTSGIWTYRKWASGVMEAYGRESRSTAMTNKIQEYSYYGNQSFTISALGFTDIKSIQVTGQASGHYFGTKVEASSTSTIQASSRASSSVTSTIDYMIDIKGLWKEFTPSVSRMNPKKGTFTCTIPRLANQNVTFNYTQVAENVLVATAEITANTSSDSGRLYLYFEGSPSGLPFTPLKGFGGCECNDVCYSMASSSNKNLWIGGLTGTMASGRDMTMRFILIG